MKKPSQNPGATPAVLVKKDTENKKPTSLTPRPLARPPAQHGVRYQLVMKLHEQLTRLYNKPTTAEEKEAVIQKTLDIEEETAKTKAAAYRSAMGHLILRLMKLTPAQYATEQKAKAAEDAKASASRGVEKPKANAVLNNYAPPVTTGLSSDSEIAEARKLIHTSSVLSKYEYTLHPPSAADIDKARKGLEAAGGYETCDRCSSRFCVFPGRRASDGALATNGPCTYHSGRRFTSRPSFSSTWSCCDTTVGETPGCSTSPSHVFKVSDPKRLSVTFAYITTPSNPEVDAEISKHGDRALALDAEMCYTTHGMEICRLSAVAFPSGEIVIDALVRPFGEVLDFNTRFSGVTAEMLSSAAPWSPKPYPPSSTPIINPTLPIASNPKLPILSSPLAARDALLKYITPETLLIGHSLGNDLDVLRLCHATVVDTMVLFPHVKGWPLRNRLKWCVERMLQREIQKEGEATGHDSVVDARCAGELVRWKVKDVLKKAKRAQTT
ncbi:hypothetical protein EX30DRAFT_306092 [Ascodesmis nigricans]|uniref:Exonuclease domain-containing protein n=1 Tax=Ascodesmis nigricans TaxID=341454 RepID=A0A4S2MYD4_9PEZI|nr:hypothetical protein EX30DRAFT_306092 [Ascodesmis nigricans]